MIKRIKGFDGLRVIAIGVVALFHMLDEGTIWFSLVKKVGLFLFPFFFIGSGYLFSTILQGELKSRGRIDLIRFYFNRILRIWPLYFLALATHMIIDPWSSRDILEAVFFIRNFFAGSFFIHSWTVSVEEQFYLICPALIFLVMRRNMFWPVMGALFALSLYLRWSLDFYNVDYENHILLWSDGFLFGILISHPQFKSAITFIQRHPLPFQALSFVLFFGLRPSYAGRFYDSTVWFFATSLLSVTVMTPNSFIGRLASAPIFRYLADRSYSFYLFHILAIKIVFEWIPWNKTFDFSLLKIIMVFLVGYAISEILYYAVEQPLQKYKNLNFKSIALKAQKSCEAD